MTPDRIREIEDLYHRARALSPDLREAFLKDAGAADADLLRAVQSLLAQDSGDGFLAKPAIEMAAGLLSDSDSALWSPGTRVGPFEIVERLGAGGMGEVFRARDTRLGRDVALKVAHQEFGARFQREARAISALNHPNICTLYDVGPNYLVMELVEGANLAGPVPVARAIDYARQIAAGLEAAHEKGVIHRDLKPANLKMTPSGTVKILDFGLAKGGEVAESGPTVTMTEKGTVLGTAAYMSPEQARGEAVDKRTDIWAFGVVLFELLTGKPLFGGGKSASEAIAAVLTREPDFAALPKDTPPRLRRILELCLRKDPKDRLRNIGDVLTRLDEPEMEMAAPARRTSHRRRVWAAGLAGLLLAGGFAGYRWWTSLPSGPFQHIQITSLTDSGKAFAAAVSPDGKYVLHSVSDEGKSSLWLLHVATGSNVQLQPPTPGSFTNPRFSRDGNSLYYVLSTGTGAPVLYRMPVLGGNARNVASFAGVLAAAISPDEKRLVFSKPYGDRTVLALANLDGSGARQLAARTRPGFIRGAAWSPDGRTIAYGNSSQTHQISAEVMAIPSAGGAGRRISAGLLGGINSLGWAPDGKGLIATINPQYPFSQLWYIAYPGGRARSITNDLNSYYGISLTGDGSALVTVQYESISHLWVVAPGDSGNAQEISTGRLDGLNTVAFAPNGDLYFEAPESGGDTQIWVAAADGAGRRQITRGEGLTGTPAPCGDGRHLLFTSFRAGNPHIFLSDLDGDNIRQVTNGGYEFRPSCSPDSTWLTYFSRDPKNLGVWRVGIDGGSPVRLWDQAVYSEISPDGKSVLVAGPNGKVTILPAAGGPAVQTVEGVPALGFFGVVLHWSPDGKALVYAKTAGGVTNIWQQPLNGGEPKHLTAFASQRITAFDISRDGRRLVLARGTARSDVVLIRDLDRIPK